MAIPSWHQAQISTTIPAPTKIVKDIQHVIVSTIIGSTIQTNILHASSLSSSTIQTNTLSITTLTGSTIQSNTFNASTTIASTIQTNGLLFTTIVGSTIQANTIQYSTIIGCTIQTLTHDAKIIIGSSIQTNTLNLSSLIGSSIQTNIAATSSLINSTILTPNLFVSSSLGSTIHTKIVSASTFASDSIQLNNLYVSTLIGSTLVGNVFQINASNVSSTSGNSIQTNILQTNTLVGSTIQTNSFIVSTINITGTNVIPLNTLNVTRAKGSTIICSTIQTTNLGNYDEISEIYGEYMTIDLGTGGNYHNQYTQIDNTGWLLINKIHFLGSNDGIKWFNLGLSVGTISDTIKIFNYTSTNNRYLRIVFIEVYHTGSANNISFSSCTISNNGETNLFPTTMSAISVSPNIILDPVYIYTTSFVIDINNTYNATYYQNIGTYIGTLITFVHNIVIVPNERSIYTLTTSTIQTNSLYSNNISGSTIQTSIMQVNTLLYSTLINGTIQTESLDVSSLIGGIIQMNTISGNTIIVLSSIQTNQIGTSTLSGSTILMNRLDTSTIIGSSIQTNQIGTSTITHSTIQMNTLIGNMNTRIQTGIIQSDKIGEYLTFDLGIGGNYHNQLFQDNSGYSNPNKIQFLGSDDGIIWISLGESNSSTSSGYGTYSYTLTNKRYLRMIFIEVYNLYPGDSPTQILLYNLSISNNGGINLFIDLNQLTVSSGFFIDYGQTSGVNAVKITTSLYSPTSWNTIGYYTPIVIIDDKNNIITNTIIGSTIQSDTFSGGTLQVSMLSGSTLIGSTIQIPQLTISTLSGSSIIGSNLQASKILITDVNKVLSTSATNATQLSYIADLTSHAGGIGQINTWTGTNTFTIAPIFTAVSTGTSLYTLGINSGNQLLTHNQGMQSISGILSINYIPYASAVSTTSNSIIYSVNATDIAIGQTTSTFPTGTGTTFTIVGLLQTTRLSATSGLFSKIIMADKRSGLNGTVISGNQGCNFYIGTMNNNGTGDLSDVLYLNSWSDSTAGNVNAVMFNKNSIGMRIYQGAVGSTSNFTTYQDAVMTDVNSGNITLGQNSNTNGITFGPNATWSSYLKIGAGPNRSYSGGVAQCYVHNGDLYLESGTGNDIYINYYSHTIGQQQGQRCTTEMYGEIRMNNTQIQTDRYAYPLVLSSNQLCRSQALTREVYRNNSVAWTGGVVLDYAFYKYNSHVPINISGKLSYYVSGSTRAYPIIRLYSQTHGYYYHYSLEAYTNNSYNHVTQFFELILTSSELPYDGWYQIYVYNAGNCISDGNDQLYVNVTILPAFNF